MVCRERTEEGEERGRWNRVAVNFNLESKERGGARIDILAPVNVCVSLA